MKIILISFLVYDSTHPSVYSLSGAGEDLCSRPGDGADLGVRLDGIRSSRRLTPVAWAIGIARREPDLLGATGGLLVSVTGSHKVTLIQ